jgi:metalloendopeptidase OMA1, mitochondrial
MSQAPIILLGCLALSMFDISLYSSKLLLDVFLSWPGSRKQEAEADYIGLCKSTWPNKPASKLLPN